MIDNLAGYRANDSDALRAMEQGGAAVGIDPEDMRRIILGQDCVSLDNGTLDSEAWARVGVALRDQAKENIAVFTETALTLGLDHPDTRSAFDEARGGAFMMGYINGFIRNYHEIERLLDEQQN